MLINLLPPNNLSVERKGKRWIVVASLFVVVLLVLGGYYLYARQLAEPEARMVAGMAAEPESAPGSADGSLSQAENGNHGSSQFRLPATAVAAAEASHVPVELQETPPAPPPPPPSMESMKKKGCVADGLLSEYGGDTERAIKLINRSECEYLHQSIETWLEAPNFEKIERYKALITKPNIVYGMFIAEAIDRSDDYYYPAEDRKFDFDAMCKEGSENKWGEHTCVPSLEREEYRQYVRYITQQAMDIGVQSFMFGQVFYQDTEETGHPIAPKIIKEMKDYAASKGMVIVVGAQTNDITDEKYLRNFDYIEGGVGIDSQGSIENGACFSRWWKQPGDWCWALLWHETYASKANNVLLHLDWSGRKGDDMATFALMDEKTRANTLNRLHTYFTQKGHGFLLPVLAVLPKDNGGCYGPKKGFYSPDKKYKCDDEEAINAILKGKYKTGKR